MGLCVINKGVLDVGFQVVIGALLGLGLMGSAYASGPGSKDVPDIAMPPAFVKPARPLVHLLNPPLHSVPGEKNSKSASARGGALGSLSHSLVFKPDLGACQSFTHGCHEGDIVTMPTHNTMNTLGAGLGMRIGGVRFEYAYGLRSRVNFIGIRTHIP